MPLIVVLGFLVYTAQKLQINPAQTCAAMRNANAPLQQLAKRYGVRWIVAGHVHQLIYADVDGVTYFAAPSSGGHLRLSHKYEDGWFFGYILVAIQGKNADFQIKEVGSPRGQGRVSRLGDWGMAGLVKK